MKADYANYKNVNLTYLARGFGLYRLRRKTPDSRWSYDEKNIEMKKKRMESGIRSENKKVVMEFA